ncbi:MAG: N-acetylmuramoyl-L-alanine amidase [Succinivibrionaceae bacterium]
MSYIRIFLTFICLFWCVNFANANDVVSIRAYEDTEKTRIVFDMESMPTYQYSLSNENKQLEVRILDIKDPLKKYGIVKITSKSSIYKVSRGRRKSEIIYIFYFKEPLKPMIFALKGESRQNPRLVVDIPNTASKQNNSIVPKVDESKDSNDKKQDQEIADLEAELFDTLNNKGDADVNKPIESVEKVMARPEPPQPKNIVKKQYDSCNVVIDPGHGGKDPGAIGNSGLKEKNVTLDISKNLMLYFNGDKKINGYLTRSNDTFIELGMRSEIARKKKADILISIHADSAANKSARGASVLVLAPNRAKRENNKLEQDKEKQKKLLGGAGEMITTISQNNPNINVADWIIEMSSDTSIYYGRELAKNILFSLSSVANLHNSKPIDRSLAVLKAPDIPSLLIETGYISNYDEERLLATPKYRREIAYAIYQGIKKFINNNETVCMHKNSSLSANESSSRTIVYEVKKGDSLSKIAQKYNVSIEEIKKLNNIKSNQVNIGKKLRIPQK